MDEPFQETAPKDRELIGRELRGLASEGCARLIRGNERRDLESLADPTFRVVEGRMETVDAPSRACGLS